MRSFQVRLTFQSRDLPEMTNAANLFAAFEACLPAAYEVSCRIRTGSPTSFWLDSPRTVASRRSIGSPVPRRRGLGRQAATRRRHGGVYEFARGCQSRIGMSGLTLCTPSVVAT